MKQLKEGKERPSVVAGGVSSVEERKPNADASPPSPPAAAGAASPPVMPPLASPVAPSPPNDIPLQKEATSHEHVTTRRDGAMNGREHVLEQSGT